MFDKDPAFVSNAFRFTLVPTHTDNGFAVIVGCGLTGTTTEVVSAQPSALSARTKKVVVVLTATFDGVAISV